MSLRPLVAICGTTGVGKSNIAVELALRLRRGGFKSGWRGAKIVNADSMQVYEGLDVITNKLPRAERKGVEHLLMDLKKPGEQYVVGQWVQDAMKLINEIHENGEVPIVIGGTSYWIQHLVFSDRLVGSAGHQEPSASLEQPKSLEEIQNLTAHLNPELLQLFLSLPESPPSAKTDPSAALKMYNLLGELDSVMAARWHWRDTRKVLRSLEIIKETGRKASTIVAEQTSRSQPRYRTLFFWLYAEPTILEKRLSERVDKMIELGLLDEIRALQKIALEAPHASAVPAQSTDVDYTTGIYQAIGYKEFHRYLFRPESSQTEFLESVDRMKLSTKQYAKRQISWIRNKLIPTINSASQDTTIYLLDATELGDQWTINVQKPALRILEGFLDQDILPEAKTLSERAQQMLTVKAKDVRPIAILEARKKLICPICTIDKDQPVMIEQGLEWDVHQKTRCHKRLAARPERNNQLGSSSS